MKIEIYHSNDLRSWSNGPEGLIISEIAFEIIQMGQFDDIPYYRSPLVYLWWQDNKKNPRLALWCRKGKKFKSVELNGGLNENL